MAKKRKFKPEYAEFNLFDSDGNQHVHNFYRLPKKSKLGGGWVAFYKKAIRALLQQAPNFSTLKVYMYMASKQTYQKCVMLTPTAIQQGLGLSSPSVALALKWLKDNDFVQMYKVDGNTGWLLNPSVTVCGGASKQSKKQLWNAGIERRKLELDKAIANREALLQQLDELINRYVTEDTDDTDANVEIELDEFQDNMGSETGE